LIRFFVDELRIYRQLTA